MLLDGLKIFKTSSAGVKLMKILNYFFKKKSTNSTTEKISKNSESSVSLVPISELPAEELLIRLQLWVSSQKDDLEIEQWIEYKEHTDVDHLQPESTVSDTIGEEAKLLKLEEKYQNDPVNLHFTYNQLIEFYFTSKNRSDDILEKCISYCLKDIELYTAFKDGWIKKDLKRIARSLINGLGSDNQILDYNFKLPKTMPSADILSGIYERQGNLQGAITVCDKVIEFGIASYEDKRRRLILKKEQADKFPSYLDYALSVLKETVSADPGINKGKLIEKLSNEAGFLSEEAHEYLALAIEKGIIHQEKRGRALIHTVT